MVHCVQYSNVQYSEKLEGKRAGAGESLARVCILARAIAKVILSVSASLCPSYSSSTRKRSIFCTIRQSDISSFFMSNFVVLSLGVYPLQVC